MTLEQLIPLRTFFNTVGYTCGFAFGFWLWNFTLGGIAILTAAWLVIVLCCFTMSDLITDELRRRDYA